MTTVEIDTEWVDTWLEMVASFKSYKKLEDVVEQRQKAMEIELAKLKGFYDALPVEAQERLSITSPDINELLFPVDI
jgi:hypothetical protein